MDLKKVALLLGLVLIGPSYAGSAQVKKVAMIEPIVVGGEVSALQRQIIRGTLEEVITAVPGYEAVTRTEVDAIASEMAFQQSGMVEDQERKEMGRLTGADLICVSQLAAEEDEIYVKSSIIEVESGKIVHSASALMQSEPSSEILRGCRLLAARLLDVELPEAFQLPQTTPPVQPQPASQPQPKQEPEEGVQIGKLIWATGNVAHTGAFAGRSYETGMFFQWNRLRSWSRDERGREYGRYRNDDFNGPWSPFNSPCPEGWRLPTYIEYQELVALGKRGVYRPDASSPVPGIWLGPDAPRASITNPGRAIFLPALGRKHYKDAEIQGLGRGYYWAADGFKKTDAYLLYFHPEGQTKIVYAPRSFAQPVRCVKDITTP